MVGGPAPTNVKATTVRFTSVPMRYRSGVVKLRQNGESLAGGSEESADDRMISYAVMTPLGLWGSAQV